MHSFKSRLLATASVPLALAVGVGVAAGTVSGAIASKSAFAACAACPNPCNPCCAKTPCNPRAAKNPCNPCAAANPCAAKNPCNPCAAANPCNPCAGKTQAAVRVSSRCVVPRIVQAARANPCAARNPCNPCAAKSACNPCAAKSPCNPCAAANPCNPCAAKNPCNPCAAANPCNPCGAGGAIELTSAEAAKAYDCVLDKMRAAYGKSGHRVAAAYQGWQRYSRVAYQSATHGNRYVQNYANAKGRAYGAFEKAGRMPVGATLAKDSFTVNGKGQVAPGPLFIMEKMPKGFNPEGGNWKYTMIMPNGSVFGETKGKNAAGMQFCIECHIAVGDDQDSMMLLPEDYRVR